MAISEDSVWLDKKSKITYPKLDTKLSVDVAIIGGGIAGVTTAYLLSKTNLKVALVEKYQIGEGTTGYTTAMITQYIDSSLEDLPQMFGAKKAKLIWQSHGEAIDLIEKIIKTEKIDCEFKRVDYQVYANSELEKEELLGEQSAAKKLGIKLDYNQGKLTLKNQAKFHPVKYIKSVAKAANKNGVQIFENSEFKDFDSQVKAKSYLVTTHLPFNKPLEFFFKQGKYKTYMLYVKIPKGTFTEGLYQDCNSPYHYFRIDSHPKFDTMLVGGEDHRADIKINPKKNYKALENYLSSLLSTDYSVLARWDGPIFETIDGLAYIGPLRGKDNVLYATGFSGNGMTYGTIAAMILSDHVQNKTNKYYQIYNAKRIPSVNQLRYKFMDYISIFAGGALKNFFTS